MINQLIFDMERNNLKARLEQEREALKGKEEKREMQGGPALLHKSRFPNSNPKQNVLSNNPVELHHEKIKELEARKKGLKEFEKTYDTLSAKEQKAIDERFQGFLEKEFGDRDIYVDDYDPFSPDHDKVQKELVGYGKEIEERQRVQRFNKEAERQKRMKAFLKNHTYNTGKDRDRDGGHDR